MALLHYITYTEPENVQSGNNVRFFVREFDTQRKTGRSLQFVQPIELIIPSFEIKREEIGGRLEQLTRDFPDKEFRRKEFSFAKEVIWALERDRKKPSERIPLPKEFLEKKTSFSQQMRFYYPPFTMVQLDGGKLVLPSKLEKSYVDIEPILEDKKGSLDIEVVDYHDSSIERITNVVLRFNDRGYIVTTFVPPFREFRGYEVISIRKNSDEPLDPKKSSDVIRKIVSDIIKSEDPLGIYGYNLSFDQSKLRGDGKEYFPGVDDSKPVFKSVQGLRNMMTKGRFSLDIYGYKFLYFNHYENNKLETHARMEGMDFKKSLPYDILAYKTKKAEAGSIEDIIECLTYVAEDGDVMFKIGESNQRKIISKALFVKREPASICTSSGRNIMKEYWEKRFFLRRNTLRNRYEFGFRRGEFNIGAFKNSLVNLKREDGIFRGISLVYPLIMIKAFWPMIEGTTDNLRFRNADEKLDSYQTLDEYISQSIQDLERYRMLIGREDTAEGKEKRMKQLDFIMKDEYGIGLFDATARLHESKIRFSRLLENAGQINYSNKFMYLGFPEEIVQEGLGFVYGKGNCLSCGKSAIALIRNGLTYQGFGISRGNRCLFDQQLMKGILMRRLGEGDVTEEEIAQYVKNKMIALERGEIKKGNLLFKDIGKRRFGGIPYGFSRGREVPMEEFIKAPSIDPRMYAQNFLDSYGDVLKVAFGEYMHSLYDALGLGGLSLRIEKPTFIEEELF